jgi:hypothetical protein
MFTGRDPQKPITQSALNLLMYRLQGRVHDHTVKQKPARKGKPGPKPQPKKARLNLFETYGIKPWTLHDIRRTLTTFLDDRRLGGAATAILGHKTDHERVDDRERMASVRGSDDEVIARLSRPAQSYQGRYSPSTTEPQEEAPEARGRGRPKLGVLAREVTLLPRQWDWLSKQPSGASATLRRLVDNARRASDQQRRERQEAAYHFMHAMGGDLPGYEEATRALFASDAAGLEQQIANWPDDIRSYVLRLASAQVHIGNDAPVTNLASTARSAS